MEILKISFVAESERRVSGRLSEGVLHSGDGQSVYQGLPQSVIGGQRQPVGQSTHQVRLLVQLIVAAARGVGQREDAAEKAQLCRLHRRASRRFFRRHTAAAQAKQVSWHA